MKIVSLVWPIVTYQGKDFVPRVVNVTVLRSRWIWPCSGLSRSPSASPGPGHPVGPHAVRLSLSSYGCACCVPGAVLDSGDATTNVVTPSFRDWILKTRASHQVSVLASMAWQYKQVWERSEHQGRSAHRSLRQQQDEEGLCSEGGVQSRPHRDCSCRRLEAQKTRKLLRGRREMTCSIAEFVCLTPLLTKHFGAFSRDCISPEQVCLCQGSGLGLGFLLKTFWTAPLSSRWSGPPPAGAGYPGSGMHTVSQK